MVKKYIAQESIMLLKTTNWLQTKQLKLTKFIG